MMNKDAASHLLAGSYYNYKYIDHGAQFRVYAVLRHDNKPTGRVIKVPLDFNESKRILLPHLRLLKLPDAEIDRRIHNLLRQKQQLPSLLQGMYARDQKLMMMLGDLKIVPRLATVPPESPGYFMPLFFTQNIVTPMNQFLHRFRFAHLPPYHLNPADIRTIQELAKQIVQLHYHLWEYGIFERSLKLENIGITSKRRSISCTLVDIGELTFDQNEAEAILRERRWKNSLSPHKTDHLFMPTIMHHHYIETCNTYFTIEALRKRWRKRPLAIEQRRDWFLRMRERLTQDRQKKINYWMYRQTLPTSLYRGLPQDRIDALEIPRSELTTLLKDNKSSRDVQDIVRIHELRERQLFIEQRRTDTIQEVTDYLFRQAIQAMSDPMDINSGG